MLAVMMALAAMMLAAAPASAQDFDDEFCEEVDGFVICDLDEFCEDLDDDFICDFNEGAFFTDGIIQETEQEAESGDIDQSFDVSQTGDNSNQTVGTQGVANTGNAQNQIGVFQIGSEADDFEFDDVGSSIEVSPTNTTSSDQQVNQVAVAG